jgi:predicted chitinase
MPNRYRRRTALVLATAITIGLAACDRTPTGASAADNVALYRGADGTFHHQTEDHQVDYEWGYPGRTDVFPVAGDWDGDGIDTVGLYRGADGTFHHIDEEGDQSDYIWGYPGRTDVFPVAGDWDGDGRDTVGLYRQADGTFHLRNEEGGQSDFVWGYPGRTDVFPVAGDWDEDGRDTVGLYRQADGTFHLRNEEGGQSDFVWGYAGRTDVLPVGGDWDQDGQDTVGLYRGGDGTFHLRNEEGGQTDFTWGYPGRTDTFPVTGDWDGKAAPVSQQVTIADIEAIWGSLGSNRPTVEAGLPSLNQQMVEAGITTPARKAAFLATIRNESGFRYNAIEGGNTSAYRGRGFIQLTGSFNYGPAGTWLGYDLLGNPDAAASLNFSAPIARWYWTVARNINPMADALDMAAVNVAIGYAPSAAEDTERCNDFKAALRHFNGGTLPAGINCTRGATAASQAEKAPAYPSDQPKGLGVGS